MKDGLGQSVRARLNVTSNLDFIRRSTVLILRDVLAHAHSEQQVRMSSWEVGGR